MPREFEAVEETLLQGGADPDLPDDRTVKEGLLRTEQGGRIIFAEDGSFAYVSAPGFSGVDSVSYTLLDEGGEDAGEETLTIEVEADAHAPFLSAGTQLSERHVVGLGTGLLGNGIATQGRTITPLSDGGYVVSISYIDQANGTTLDVRAYDADHNQVGDLFDPGLVFSLRVDAVQDGYVVAWETRDSTNVRTVHVQLFDADGVAVGGTSQVDVPGDVDGLAAVAPLPGGGYVVLVREAEGSGASQLYAQSFDATGAPVGNLVAIGEPDQYRSPAVLPNGEIVLTSVENLSEVYFQRFDTQGNAIDPERVFVADSGTQVNNAVIVTSMPDGGFALNWPSHIASLPLAIFQSNVRLVDADGGLGALVTSEPIAMTHIFGAARPTLIPLANGGFVVHTRGTYNENNEIEHTAQVYDADGNEVGDRIVLGTFPPFGIMRLVGLQDGGFAAIGGPAGTDDSAISVQVYDNNGTKVGDVRLEDGNDGAVMNTAVTRLANGEVIILESETIDSLGISRVSVQTLDVGIGSKTPVVESGVTFDEDTGGTVAFVVSLPDQDGSEIVASVVIAGVPAGWTLGHTAESVVFDDVTGLWTVAGTAVDHDGEVALTLTAPANVNGNATLTVTANTVDTINGETSQSLPVNIEVTVTPVSDAPAVDLDRFAPGLGHAATFIEGGPAVAITGAVNIFDPDSATMVSATVTLRNPQPGDELLLTGPLPAGISASAYDPATGVLTLSGSASADAYEAALALIVFNGAGTADRLIDIVVSDGGLDSIAATATIAIIDPMVTISNASVVEGDDGTTQAVFTVTRTGDLDPFTVGFATADGTALAGQDYLAASGTLVFAAGEIIKTVAIEVLGDHDLEADETFLVNLFNPTGGAVLVDAQGVGTIVNDDTSPARLSISPGSVAQVEGDDGTVTFLFTVTRGGNTERAASAEWKLSGAPEATSSDFAPGQALSGTVSFAAGETVRTIAVEVAGDTEVEPDEHFAVTLSKPSPGTVITTAQAIGTIVSDDTSLSIAATDAVKAEGDAGTTEFVFTVTRIGGTEGELSAAYAVGGALPGDFGGTRPTGEITFAAGEAEKQIVIQVTGDTVAEADQPFTLTLTDADDNTLAIGHGTIENDDPALFDAAFAGPILRLYQAVLGRLPDPEGLAFWIDQFTNGRPLIDLAGDFVDSDEFRGQHGGVTDGSDPDFVATLYTNVLGRDPDPDGFAFWTGLDDPDPAEIVLKFSQSAEYVARTGPAIEDFLADAQAGTQDYRGHLLDTNDDSAVDQHDAGAIFSLAVVSGFADALL